MASFLVRFDRVRVVDEKPRYAKFLQLFLQQNQSQAPITTDQ